MNEQETEQTRDLATEEIDEVTGGAGFDAICGPHDNWHDEWIFKYFKVCI